MPSIPKGNCNTQRDERLAAARYDSRQLSIFGEEHMNELAAQKEEPLILPTASKTWYEMNTVFIGVREPMLTITESARLLRQIFPNYPNASPACPIPPRTTWYFKPEDLREEETLGGTRYWAAGVEVSRADYDTLKSAISRRK